MTNEEPAPLPWYRFFWPWFIVCLLATSVTAGITTVIIAVRSQDSLVSDDWYEEGTAINRRFERDALARTLGVRAVLGFDAARGELTLTLSGESTDRVRRLRLELAHPTHSEQDTVVILERMASGRFRGAADTGLAGRYYAAIEPVDETADAAAYPKASTSWRLSRMLTLPAAQDLLFGADG